MVHFAVDQHALKETNP